ncbi:hypothetical protein [Prevotella histicola]|uniref:Fimbrillin family protein n=1 Tax=Prevotella histicola F0411 TaxID=857291 RepID=G6AF10_9BACT|nr:hypothetical protein [Prevotella histicola]EHG16857.1 hypothetical protein HMPREF9138_00687 [Prevotella histicola F0411]QUB84434.1 hypothetical protein J5A62_03595 [Prevotella histicola]
MKKDIFHYALSAFVVGGMALSFASCSDDDLAANQGGSNDALVRFSVNDVQSEAIARGAAMTRGAITPGLGNNDLAGQKLAAHSNRNLNVCFIETAVEGVNPVKADAHTRAEIETTISGDFSSTGIRGVAATSILTTPEWFKAAKTKRNGELYTPIRWSIFQPWARFYAVYPSKDSYSKLTINDMTSTDNAPSVDFTVESNVRDQKDFMTACTGEVHYATQGEHPTTNLDFRHALTAIRFAVGQNLSWSKVIDKVEIRNAIMKSKYKLSSEFSGTGAAWDNTGATRGTATLSGLSVSTSQNPNATIMGNTGDNFTFYMIPQELTGNNVVAYVHFTDNTEITATLKGEWKAGTTRTLKLSETNSTWSYVLTPTDPNRAAKYDETTSQPYGITSYRTAPDGTTQAVKWKVVGYSVDGGSTYTANKPAWLTALSKESGDGGTAADQGTATLTKDVADLLALRNKTLKETTITSSASAPYDLSLHDHNGNTTLRNTANSYLISAPGHYRIPLVYGNAIENGATNANSYISHAPTGTPNEPYVLRNFKDHAGANITDPWIEKTNGGANSGVNGAEVVWADAADLVHSPSIAHVGGEGFLDFEVTAADIQSGNAVVAVTKGSGASKTVLWSWHLWFAPKDALDKIKVTNRQNKDYYFTKEALGWKPTLWRGSTYDKPRTVKVKVVQTIKNGGVAQETVINIIQNPDNVKKGATTLYQFGRKDAFPGVAASDLAANSHFTENAGDNMTIMNNIQNPDKFYIYGSLVWTNYGYYNLWSADNTETGGYNQGNDNPVVKTVYDPCPVGFKMPANNAFTGFTTTGQNSTSQSEMNVDGTDERQQWTNNFGHNFWTNSSKTATINFPASGFHSYLDGSLNHVGGGGCYWSAVPYGTGDGCGLNFYSDGVFPLYGGVRAYGFSVRAVSE